MKQKLILRSLVVSLFISLFYFVGYDVEAAGQKYVTTANLNVRTGPGTNYYIVGVIPKGQTVQFDAEVNKTWVRIVYGNKKRYVSKAYLKRVNKEVWENESIPVVKEPTAVTVLVNKSNRLPDGYIPTGLVEVPVTYLAGATSEKRKLRSDASKALVGLFGAAKKAGVPLAGVSGYRSFATQTSLFKMYVQRDGYEKARTYSAVPGTSEHQTGLSIDVAGVSGKCAVQDCFASTNEAKWLAKHASDYGFIIRYPKGKEKITGYKYEPWHLRYVGWSVAKKITQGNSTMEEYFAK